MKQSITLLKYADTFNTFRSGDVIFKEGEAGSTMYVVKTGTVELRIGERKIETLETGALLGEMALLDGEKRSATAVAVTDCQLVPVDHDRFLYMVRQTPYFALEVMQIMAQRLRHMNRTTPGK